MSKLLSVFLSSLTPIGELRLSIPLGILHFHLNPFLVFLISIIGNLIPPILIILFFEKISKFLSKKIKLFEIFFRWVTNRAEQKKQQVFKNTIKNISLASFIAVPLPFTGAWTGALIAILAGFTLKDAILSIFWGVLGAGIIVTILTMFGIVISSNFNLVTILGVLITILILGFLIYKKLKTKINF